MIYNITIALGSILLAAVSAYLFIKGREKAKRARVSEEGYETAYDILFTKRKTKKYTTAS